MPDEHHAREATTDGGPYEVVAGGGLSRRSFVKGMAMGAAVGAAAASGVGILKQAAPLDPYNVRMVSYLGAQQGVKSPAPRGLPLIPVRVDADGFVAGVPEDDEENYLDWYRYCSHEMAPGLLTGEADDVFRYFLPAEKLEKAGDEVGEVYWYHERLGERVRADHFADLPYGTGASVRWRSEGQSGSDVVTALVVKLDPTTFQGLDDEGLARFMDMDHHLIGYSTFCTHFCCVPGYREDPVARRLGVWDQIYCGCHGSRFDPHDIRRFSFELRVPRD